MRTPKQRTEKPSIVFCPELEQDGTLAQCDCEDLRGILAPGEELPNHFPIIGGQASVLEWICREFKLSVGDVPTYQWDHILFGLGGALRRECESDARRRKTERYLRVGKYSTPLINMADRPKYPLHFEDPTIALYAVIRQWVEVPGDEKTMMLFFKFPGWDQMVRDFAILWLQNLEIDRAYQDDFDLSTEEIKLMFKECCETDLKWVTDNLPDDEDLLELRGITCTPSTARFLKGILIADATGRSPAELELVTRGALVTTWCLGPGKAYFADGTPTLHPYGYYSTVSSYDLDFPVANQDLAEEAGRLAIAHAKWWASTVQDRPPDRRHLNRGGRRDQLTDIIEAALRAGEDERDLARRLVREQRLELPPDLAATASDRAIKARIARAKRSMKNTSR